MKITHVVIGLEEGGAERMLKRLVDSHRENPKWRHSVVSLTNVGRIGAKLRDNGVKVVALDMRSALGVPFGLLKLIFLLLRQRPDIVQTWMYHADLIGGLAARIAGNQHVIWGIRTTEIRAVDSLGTVIVRWLCARLSHWTPQLIVCASESARRSHILIGYDSTKMVVLQNGYDFFSLRASYEERLSIREQYSVKQHEMLVGSLGRFHPDKDQENFVRAAKLLAAQYSHLRFLMVGRSLDWNNSQLVLWIENTGFRERFVLLGERSDVPQCLAAMDIFCLHSRTEAFPNALAEAMAIGLPCVATDVGDASMILGGTGVVVAKENVEALAQGINKLVTMNQDARDLLGKRAKARVENEFSMVRARERFEAAYQRVLGTEEK